MKNNLDVPVATVRQDDSYCTRQHAFNIGLAFGSVGTTLSVCVVVMFQLEVLWLLRLLLISVLIGVTAFAIALVIFTREARDIQWQAHIPKDVEAKEVYKETSLTPIVSPNVLRAHFPSPNNENGMLFTDVKLTEQQRIAVAQAALNHGKITVNYLTSIGIKRDDAERLREELVGHNLLMFNEKNEAVLTERGAKSFEKLIK